MNISKRLIFLALLWSASSVSLAAEDWTKGLLSSNFEIKDKGTVTAKLSHLSPSAIERGLRNTEIVANTKFNKKTNVLSFEWHTLIKDIDGNEYAQKLEESLTSRVRVSQGTTTLTVGQELVIKGDLEQMLGAFDKLLKKAADNNQDANNELSGSGASVGAGATGAGATGAGATGAGATPATSTGGSSSSGTSGNGALGGGSDLSEKADIAEPNLKIDNITETVEKCSLKVSLAEMKIFEQERVIKTSTESGEVTETGACKNVGAALEIRKDFEAGCTLKMDNESGQYIKGFKLYSFVAGSRYDVSECDWDAKDAIKYNVFKDLKACSSKLAIIDLKTGQYQPAFTKYTVIDNNRMELSSCITSPDVIKQLPTKVEQCDFKHDIANGLSYRMQRTDIYDPENQDVISVGECKETSDTYKIKRDFEAGCTTQINEKTQTYQKGYKYFTNINGQRYSLSECEWGDQEPIKFDVVKDYDACSLTQATVNDNGTYNPAFINYTLINGERSVLSGCVTETDDFRPLPTKVEQCEYQFNTANFTAVGMQRTDTYDPTNTVLVAEGKCTPNEKNLPIQKDFEAGCKTTIDTKAGTYTKGYKLYAFDGDTRLNVSECQWDKSDAIAYEAFNDFEACSIDLAITNTDNDTFYPAFVGYTIIDGTRNNLSGCVTDETVSKPLPKKVESCDYLHDLKANITFKMQRTDIYNPKNSDILKTGECQKTDITYPIEKNFSAGCDANFNLAKGSVTQGYKLFSNINGKVISLSECKWSDSDSIAYTVQKDFDSCSLEKAVSSIDTGFYNPAYIEYTDFNGERKNLSECITSVEIKRPLPTRLESCDLLHDVKTNTAYIMQRTDIYNPENDSVLKTGECQKTGVSFAVNKDFSAGCDASFNADSGTVTKGYKLYTTINGKRVPLSECQWSDSDSIAYKEQKDFDSCSLNKAVSNADEGTYSPAFIKYTNFNGERKNLSECVTSVEITRPLPTKVESCELQHDLKTLTTFAMQRTDIYNPENTSVLKTGVCQKTDVTYAIEKDFSAGCDANFNADNGTVTKGYKFYTNVNGQTISLSECKWSDSDAIAYKEQKDFDSCSLNKAVSNADEGTYSPAFVRYTIFNGERKILSSCVTSNEIKLQLPTKVEDCDLLHDFKTSTIFAMQRTDIYNPENDSVLKTGVCQKTGDTYAIEKDFSAGCDAKFDSVNGTVTQGYKLFSNVNEKRLSLGECQWSKGDAIAYETFKDFDSCSLDKAVSNTTEGFYNPAFIQYTSFDGERKDLTECITSVEIKRPLPTRVESCDLLHDLKTNTTFAMQRTDIYDPQNRNVLKTGECSKTDISYPIVKDFSADCDVNFDQAAGTMTKGHKLYTNVNGETITLSECQWDKSDAIAFKTQKDFDSCSLDKAVSNIETGFYYPAYIEYTNVNGERKNLSECTTSIEITRPLPTKVESCDLLHDFKSSTTYAMQRTDIYDPENRGVLKTGECVKSDKSYMIKKDFTAGCPTNIDKLTGKATRGFKYYSNVEGTVYKLSECEWNDSDAVDYEVFNDFDACSIDQAKINLDLITYNSAFRKYTILDGDKSYLSECITSEDFSHPLPTKLETCDYQHDINNLTSYSMTRTDIYDPENSELLKIGACIKSGETFAIERDYEADCTTQIDQASGKFTKGFKFYSFINNKHLDVSACQWDKADATNFDVIKDYEACSLDKAVVDVATGYYQPAFIKFINVDGKRSDLSACITEADDKRLLPTKVEQCDYLHDVENVTSYTMQRTDIYDPKNRTRLKEGECLKTGETFAIKRDYDAGCTTQIDQASGKSTRGYKLYSFIDNKRLDVSACQWDKADATTIDVVKDYDSCSLDKAVVDVATGYYQPAFINFINVDGKRSDLSACITEADDKRLLPTSVEQCEYLHDVENVTSYTMQRTDIYDPKNRTRLKEGECLKTGETFAIKRDYDAGCTTQIDQASGKSTKGFKLYAFVDNKRLDVSACQWDKADATNFDVVKDYEACSIDNAMVDVATGYYQPAFIKFINVDGKRSDLTACITEADDKRLLPTKVEQCDYLHDVENVTSYTMQRTDIYDPKNSTKLKEGECLKTGEVFAINRDFEAGCTTKIDQEKGTYIKGFKYFSFINNKRLDVSACQWDSGDAANIEVIKDYDACSLDKAVVDVETGYYQPAFINYTLINGVRSDLSGCVTAADDKRLLPTKVEQCDYLHDIENVTSYTMQHTDIYDPKNSTKLKEGECLKTGETFAIERDYEAGCTTQIDQASAKYTKGYKLYSFIDNKRLDVSACKWDKSDATDIEVVKDYEACSLDKAVIDVATGYYQPAFIKYTLINGVRSDLSGCVTAADDKRLLPTKVEQCDYLHDVENVTSYTMQHTDIYDPKNSTRLKEGECLKTGETFAIERDYEADCTTQIDQASGKYTKGYKLFSFINNKRLDVSACKWDKADATTIDVVKDYEACSLDNAVVDVATGYYQPAFIKFINVDGKRSDLSACITEADDKRLLPTKVEQCDYLHDVKNVTSYTMQRTDIYDPKNSTKLKEGECLKTGETFAIERDYEADCSANIDIKAGTFTKGFILYTFIESKRLDVSACQWDLTEAVNYDVIKDYDNCSLDKAVVTADTGFYNPAFINYTLVNGVRSDLSACITEADDKRLLPTRVESCNYLYDRESATTFEMSRTDIYDPQNRDLLKEGECTKTLISYPIMKDFEAGCTTRINQSDNKLIRGYKAYSMINAKRIDVGECEWDTGDEITYTTFMDFESCSVDDAVIDLDNLNYQPSFMRYTNVDGQRIDVTGCMNDSTITKLLPIRIEDCELENDIDAETSYIRKQKDIYGVENKAILKEGKCERTGETYPIKRDYEFRQCDDLPDFTKRKLGLGYKNYVDIPESPLYINDCIVDFENAISIDQDIEECSVTENLIINKAIVNKRWFYDDNLGVREFVTDCRKSDETYDIIDTTESCTPVYIESQNKMVPQSRKAWIDGYDNYHFVSGCRSSSIELDIKKEICSPKYEHDFDGGQSYLISRDYYEDNDGKRTYLNECSRDRSISYEHSETSEGCKPAVDDQFLQVQLWTKIFATLDTGITEIRGCIASSKAAPYIKKETGIKDTSKHTQTYRTAEFRFDKPEPGLSYPTTLKEHCALNPFFELYGEPTYEPTGDHVMDAHRGRVKTYGGYGVSAGYVQADLKTSYSVNFEDWERPDGTIYRKWIDKTCTSE